VKLRLCDERLDKAGILDVETHPGEVPVGG